MRGTCRQSGNATLHGAAGIPREHSKSPAAADSLAEFQLLEGSSEDWNVQIYSREDGLESEIPTAVRGPDKGKHALFCTETTHYHYKNLTLAPDKKNGSAEDLGTHKSITKLRYHAGSYSRDKQAQGFTPFCRKNPHVGSPVMTNMGVFGQTMCSFFEKRKSEMLCFQNLYNLIPSTIK